MDGLEVGDKLDIDEELANGYEPRHLQEAIGRKWIGELPPMPTSLSHNYSVVEDFDDPWGKFGD